MISGVVFYLCGFAGHFSDFNAMSPVESLGAADPKKELDDTSFGVDVLKFVHNLNIIYFSSLKETNS